MPRKQHHDDDDLHLTAAQLRTGRPGAEVYPELVHTPVIVRRVRGPQKSPTKRAVSLRLDGEILEAFRATGKGWQSRINDTLAKHLPRQTRQLKRVAGRGRASRHG